jgi:hypothetical protein
MRIFCVSIFLVIILSPVFLFAQNAPYSAGMGGRLEENQGTLFLGPTYRYYFNSKISGEVFALSDFSNGIEFYGFGQYGGSIFDMPPNLRWITGLGAHVGTWKGYHDSLVAGADGMLGLEYALDKYPVSFSLDWHPLVNIVSEKKTRFWLL